MQETIDRARRARLVHLARRMSPASPLLLLVLLAVLSAALLLTPGESAAFYVTGTVRDATMQGIAGVDIDAHDSSTGANIPISNDGTHADGSYAIFLAPGTYDISFTAPAGQPYVGVKILDVPVMDHVDLDAVMPDGFFIFGTVRAPDLTPVAGADIDIYDSVTQEKLFTPNDNTDLNGFFVVVVPAGTYDLTVQPVAGSVLPAVRDNGIVVSADTQHNRTLPAGVTLSGVVTDPDGGPLEKVDLNAFDSVSGLEVTLSNDKTDSLGTYQVALVPGVYDFKFRAPAVEGYDRFVVNNVSVFGNTTLDAQLVFPWRVTGVVRDGLLLPVQNVKLKVYNLATGDRIPIPSDRTDSGGLYDIMVPEGWLDFKFLSPEGNGLASMEMDSVQVLGDTQLDMTLPAGVTLTGTVTDPLGAPVAGVDLDPIVPATGVQYPAYNDNTDAFGNYTLVLPAGTYDLDFDAGPGVPLVAELHLGIAVPAIPVFDVQLAAGFFVSGNVIDHGSNPWEGIDIDVRFPGTPNQIITHRDNTDANGDYVVVVPPGTYNFLFTPLPGMPVEADSLENVVVAGDMVLDMVLASTLIGVADAGAPARAGFRLLPNRPNPFNPATRIEYRLDRRAPVRLGIYDAGGRLVRLLESGVREAGRHQLDWNGRNDAGAGVASGVYFLRLATPDGVRGRKLVLAR